MLYLIRRNDRLDPLSPRFQGEKAIDDLTGELDDRAKPKHGHDPSQIVGDE